MFLVENPFRLVIWEFNTNFISKPRLDAKGKR